MSGKIGIGGVFEIECYDKDGMTGQCLTMERRGMRMKVTLSQLDKSS